MAKQLTLRQYVRKRNGVALGSPGSLSNMLRNALGAKKFYVFWLYWNPIWGYYLATFCQKPLSKVFHHSFALIVTFAISGLLHDLALMLLEQTAIFVCAPWFTLMGLITAIAQHIPFNFASLPWFTRAFINCSIVFVCFICSHYLTNFM